MKCEEIKYRTCKAKVGSFSISMSTQGLSNLVIKDTTYTGNPYISNTINLPKEHAKKIILEALAIIEELE